MKKFTLFLLAMLMMTVTFAQIPHPLGKRLSAAEAQNVTLMAGQKAPAMSKAAMAVSHSIGQDVPTKGELLFRNSLKPQHQLNFTEVKFAQQNGAQANLAPKANDTTPVQVPADLVTETYVFTGASYVEFTNVTFDVQVGYDGNDVYIQGLLRSIPEGWIKGVKEGDKLTFPKGQYLGEAEIHDYDTGENLGMFPAWLGYQDPETGAVVDCVFSVNLETGVIDDFAEGAIMFLTDSGDLLDALLGTRLTPQSLLSDVSYDLVTLPETAEPYGVDITAYSTGLKKQVANTGQMSIVGNDFYVLGLTPEIAGWVKGTLGADGNVTFKKGQYLGSYYGMFDMWFMAVDPDDKEGKLKDAIAAWDPVNRTLTFDEHSWIAENADPVSLYYADVLSDVFVAPMTEERTVVIPPAGLETRPHRTTVASLGNYSYAKDAYTVNIGFDGDDAYMQGLLFFAPSAWLKGTRNADGSITFTKNQYLGTVQGYDVYVVPCDDDENVLDDFTFTYDAEKDTYYYIEQNTNISYSVAPESTDAIEIIFNVVMKGPDAPEEEVVNTDVIFEQPEGELKVYTRSGGAYYSFWGYLVETSQNGTSIKVVTNGNDIYMENPISQGQVEGGTWVKGTLDGNKIHMPLKQCVLYFDTEGYGYMTAAFRTQMVYDEDYGEEYLDYVMTDEEEVAFTIHEDGTITMDQKSEIDPETGVADWIYGLAYTDDKTWAQYGDYNTVYTPFNEEYATMPEGLVTETWAMMYSDGNYSSARLCDVAIDGDKMYIAGMSEYDPEAVMVGTIADGKVTIASDQYIGLNSGYVAYGVFASYTTEMAWDEIYEEEYEVVNFNYLTEYSFTYDAEKKLMTSADDIAFIVNAGKGAEEILYISVAYAPKFNYFKEVAAVPADPEFLGYENYFDGYGYDMIACNVNLEDIHGNYINQDKVFYTIWVKLDGEAEQFVFDAQDYVGFAELGIEELFEVPVNLVVYDDYGYEDISASASNICIYQTGFDDFGIQTIYYGGDKRTQSNIVWYSGEVTNVATPEEDITAISHVNPSASKASIYDLQGRQLQKLQKGINIIRMNGKDLKIVIK